MPSPRYIVLYDDQCEICQAGGTWLRILDREGLTELRGASPDALCSLREELGLNLDQDLDPDHCLRELHVVTPEGRVVVGWEAVVTLARLFRPTWLLSILGSHPPGRWIGRALYRYVAANRYSLSKCRGARCRIADPELARRSRTLRAFWTCRLTGLLLRIPLIGWAMAGDFVTRLHDYLRTRRKRVDLLGDKLRILFLGGIYSDLIPVFFGEMFTAVLYDGVLIDPGSTRMRRSLERHLRKLEPDSIQAIAATHYHEEHVGNLNWVGDRTGKPVYASTATAAMLREAPRLPWIRHLLIGSPPALRSARPLDPGSLLPTGNGMLQVFAAPGHSDDHVVFYDPEEKLLLVGDAFMGSYFSTPNPDVDSLRWSETLRALLELEIEILVEGHGHIHTLRPDIPDVPGLVTREDPRDALRRKLEYLEWVRNQVETGMAEGLPVGAIEATCFPWGKRWSWERFGNDELTRLLSLGHFSRSELIRSFVRHPGCSEALPTTYEVRIYARRNEEEGEEETGRGGR